MTLAVGGVERELVSEGWTPNNRHVRAITFSWPPRCAFRTRSTGTSCAWKSTNATPAKSGSVGAAFGPGAPRGNHGTAEREGAEARHFQKRRWSTFVPDILRHSAARRSPRRRHSRYRWMPHRTAPSARRFACPRRLPAHPRPGS